MDQKTISDNIMEAFQKLNPQGQNAVFRNLYEVTQKTRAQLVMDHESSKRELQKAIVDMDSILSPPFPMPEGDLILHQSVIPPTASYKKGPDYAFESKGVKSDTLDDCRH